MDLHIHVPDAADITKACAQLDFSGPRPSSALGGCVSVPAFCPVMAMKRSCSHRILQSPNATVQAASAVLEATVPRHLLQAALQDPDKGLLSSVATGDGMVDMEPWAPVLSALQQVSLAWNHMTLTGALQQLNERYRSQLQQANNPSWAKEAAFTLKLYLQKIRHTEERCRGGDKLPQWFNALVQQRRNLKASSLGGSSCKDTASYCAGRAMPPPMGRGHSPHPQTQRMGPRTCKSWPPYLGTPATQTRIALLRLL